MIHIIKRLSDHLWRSVLLTTIIATHVPLWWRVEYLVTDAGYDLSTVEGIESVLVAITYLMTSYYLGLVVLMPVIGIFREHIQYLIDRKSND